MLKKTVDPRMHWGSCPAALLRLFCAVKDAAAADGSGAGSVVATRTLTPEKGGSASLVCSCIVPFTLISAGIPVMLEIASIRENL